MSVSTRTRNKHQRSRAPRAMLDEVLLRAMHGSAREGSGLANQGLMVPANVASQRSLADEAYYPADD